MPDQVDVVIPVHEETARHLAGDARRTAAVGHLVDRMVRPAAGAEDPLAALLTASAEAAAQAGLTQAEIDAELAAYNAERRDG